MSVEKAFRAMVRQEVQNQVRPLQLAVASLQNGVAGLGALRNALTPLSGLLGKGNRVRRGRTLSSWGGKTKLAKRERAESGANDRPCALADCKRDARSKGYCAAHYQKFRNLALTHRLPADWTEYAPPNSVSDIVLPRGRAAAKALKLAREKRS